MLSSIEVVCCVASRSHFVTCFASTQTNSWTKHPFFSEAIIIGVIDSGKVVLWISGNFLNCQNEDFKREAKLQFWREVGGAICSKSCRCWQTWCLSMVRGICARIAKAKGWFSNHKRVAKTKTIDIKIAVKPVCHKVPKWTTIKTKTWIDYSLHFDRKKILRSSRTLQRGFENICGKPVSCKTSPAGLGIIYYNIL